jgi:hypothetical protein
MLNYITTPHVMRIPPHGYLLAECACEVACHVLTSKPDWIHVYIDDNQQLNQNTYSYIRIVYVRYYLLDISHRYYQIYASPVFGHILHSSLVNVHVAACYRGNYCMPCGDCSCYELLITICRCHDNLWNQL